MDWNDIVLEARHRRASDIHMVCGQPLRFRVDGSLTNFDDHVLTPADCESMGRELCGEQFSEIEKMGEIDLARSFAGHIRCRINAFRQQGCVSAAVRLLSSQIPVLENLGLPESVYQFVDYPRGIVLVTGETGSGKSTTMAAMLDRINHSRNEHIITLEDPIEYVYAQDRCTINQREIGRDTASYASGLRSILREDPDVILIGELRDLETIETALTAAETGHLVFATVHTNSAADTVDRLVSLFPSEKQQQIRLQLSTTLCAALAQQLLPRKSGEGRVLACEVLIANTAIRSLIREGKTSQINNAIATSAADGNISMDTALIRLVKNNSISAETAVRAAHDAGYVNKSLQGTVSRW